MKDKKIEEIIKKFGDTFTQSDDGRFYKKDELGSLVLYIDCVKFLRQTLLDFQQEVREETLREILPQKIKYSITPDFKSIFNYLRDKIISTAKEKFNINLE